MKHRTNARTDVPRDRLRARRRERVYAAYAEAARDPEFMAEMADIDRAFDVTGSDGAQ